MNGNGVEIDGVEKDIFEMHQNIYFVHLFAIDLIVRMSYVDCM